MAIKKVWMEEGCTACGMCEDTCPAVFQMDGIAVVVQGVDYIAHEQQIKEAAENCPVEIIKYS